MCDRDRRFIFEASGQVRWGRDRRDGPAGESDSFFIDMSDGIRMRSTGRLFLGINDEVRTDNGGAFRVVVYH